MAVSTPSAAVGPKYRLGVFPSAGRARQCTMPNQCGSSCKQGAGVFHDVAVQRTTTPMVTRAVRAPPLYRPGTLLSTRMPPMGFRP